MPDTSPGKSALIDPIEYQRARLAELQQVIYAEIPMCESMGIVVETDETIARRPATELVVSMSLLGNHNHQGTAFAGSLNALCTIAGWGATYLFNRDIELSGQIERAGGIVIRRSSIKYYTPVVSPKIEASCLPVDPNELAYFREMMIEKGQGKIDLTSQIAGPDPNGRPAVVFQGSYVVMPAS